MNSTFYIEMYFFICLYLISFHKAYEFKYFIAG